MLDIRLFREDPNRVRKALRHRSADEEAVDAILAIDRRRRELVQEGETLKARRNEISKLIPQRAKAKEPIEELKEESRSLGPKIAECDAQIREVDDQLREALLSIPNIPADDVPVGADESANRIIRQAGELRQFAYQPKGHWELGEALGILDLPRGAKVAGSGFYTLRGAGARLERALTAWMLDVQTGRNGYTEVSVPYLVNRRTMTGTGQLPKFEDDSYRIDEEDFFLIPTAEVPVTNLHADEIIEPGGLPIAYCCHTPCFRREAGSAGRENRGISRIHQFQKVELVHIVRPEESEQVHEELTAHAAGLLEDLGLPYRVVELCTGDLGFAAAKCYDLEVYAPGMDTWLEVSSCSNFLDFQARRASIRYRPAAGEKPQFVHTLNGSGLALPRLMIAIMEVFQNKDGSIALPEVLHSHAGMKEIRP